MVGRAISDNKVVCEAACNEIIRRFFNLSVQDMRKGNAKEQVAAVKILMKQVGVSPDKYPLRNAALQREAKTGKPAGAMLLHNGEIITGKTTGLLGCASSLLLNALKRQGNIEDVEVIKESAIEPICKLKTDVFHNKNPRLHSDETLLALSASSSEDVRAQKMIEIAGELRGCDAFFSVILSPADEKLYKTLGINVCCEPKFERSTKYHR